MFSRLQSKHTGSSLSYPLRGKAFSYCFRPQSFHSQRTGLRLIFCFSFYLFPRKNCLLTELPASSSPCFLHPLAPYTCVMPPGVGCSVFPAFSSAPFNNLWLRYLLLGVAVALGSSNTAFSPIISKSIAKCNFHQVCRQIFGLVCSHVAKNWPLISQWQQILTKGLFNMSTPFFLLPLAVWKIIYAHPFCSNL